jgi:hypothetical protein
MELAGFGWLRVGSSGGLFEHGNEPSGRAVIARSV